MAESKYIDGLVSVVIPMYNSAKYITPTIKSALNQTYKNIEVLVIDDCSKDNSVEVVNSIAQSDLRLHCIPQEKNQGAAVARNRGIKEAKGQYIAFLDSDDLWAEDKIEKQVALMKAKNAAFVYCAYDSVNENDEQVKGKITIKKRVRYKDLLTRTYICTPAAIYDRNVIGDAEMPLRRTGQDYAFWMVLLKKTDAFGIDEALVHVRRRSGSLSKNKFQNLKDIWEVQTINEGINKISASWHLFRYAIFTFKKRFF